jgi:hypothetical protein
MGKCGCWICLLAVGLAMLPGCSGRGGPELAPVSGKITLEGKPLAGAHVTFTAKDAPRAALGTTDAQGLYQLTTFRPNDGAVLGKHTVTVTMPAKGTAEMSAAKPDAAYGEAMRQASKGVAPRGSEIPAKYANPATSELSAEVKKGKNEFSFDLKP